MVQVHGGFQTSSTKSHRLQAKKEGGWVMAIFGKSPSIKKIVQGVLVLYYDNYYL